MTFVMQTSTTKPFPPHLAALLALLLGGWSKMREKRHMHDSLGALSDRQLQDIGLARGDISQASLCAHQSGAMTSLQDMRALRSCNW